MPLLRTGVRFRLFLLAGISILPFVAYLAHSFGERRQADMVHAKHQILAAARLIALLQNRVLARSRQLLVGLAVADEQPGGSLLGPGCRVRLMQLLEKAQAYQQVAVFDVEGNLICSAIPVSRDFNIKDREYFKRAVSGGEFLMSGLINNRSTGAPSLVVAHALRAGGPEVRAVLVALVNLNLAQDILKQVALPPDALATLVDSEGNIFAGFPDTPEVLGTKVMEAEEFKRVSSASPEGSVDTVDRRGEGRMVAFSRISDFGGTGIFARVGVPNSAAVAAANHTLRDGLIALAAIVALAGVGVWFGSSYLFVRPVGRLTLAAEALRKGALWTRTGLNHSEDEIGRLAATIDLLASHLQRKTRALRALSQGNRTILREREEEALLHAMCGVAVRHAGYPLALVNYAKHDDKKSVVTIARAGDDKGFIETLDLSWADTERGRGTVGTAIRTGKCCVLNSVAQDARFGPWREDALKRGYKAIVSFPIGVEGEIIGAFTLFAQEEDAFDADELELLDEMAADLSFGISVIRARIRGAEAEGRAERAATHDALTDLPNGASFIAHTAEAMRDAKAAQEPFALLVVHLPRLQEVYDSLGYGPADAIVEEVAGRLRRIPIASASLARSSLEDFAVALPRGGAKAAELGAQTLLTAFQQPVQAGDLEFDVQVAVGASFYPGHGLDADILLRRASTAARDAVYSGMSYIAYRGTTERENPQRLEIAGELRKAIDQGALILHYQPKLDFATDRICACEALVRWPHPRNGMIAPGLFVPIAEQSGLIRDMTYLVIEAASRQQRSWSDAGRPLPIAVNLSVRNLYDPDFLRTVDGFLATWGLAAELIEFEITESALMEKPDIARAAIAALRERGSKIYIDDFGTGYSSLSYLVSLPVHALKIDRAFVTQMTKSRQATSIVASVVSMAHGLGIRVVAEGVETAEELAQLRDMGCDEVQGYYVGQPVPADQFTCSTTRRGASSPGARSTVL